MVEDKAKVRFSRQWSNHSLSGVVSASARSSMQEAGSRKQDLVLRRAKVEESQSVQSQSLFERYSLLSELGVGVIASMLKWQSKALRV